MGGNIIKKFLTPQLLLQKFTSKHLEVKKF
jgi:hypothetical protein